VHDFELAANRLHVITAFDLQYRKQQGNDDDESPFTLSSWQCSQGQPDLMLDRIVSTQALLLTLVSTRKRFMRAA
jgi:hypothetical protein